MLSCKHTNYHSLITSSVVIFRRTLLNKVLPERLCVTVCTQSTHDESNWVSLAGHVFAFRSLQTTSIQPDTELTTMLHYATCVSSCAEHR